MHVILINNYLNRTNGRSSVDFSNYKVCTQNLNLIIIRFPKFVFNSICNQNSFTKNLNIQYGKDIMAANYITDVFNALNFGNDLMTFIFARYMIGMNLINPAVNNKIKKLMGFELEDMMISCMYALAPCTASDFEWYFDINYGIQKKMCFIHLKINPPNIKVSFMRLLSL
jgi:hypothetical protein